MQVLELKESSQKVLKAFSQLLPQVTSHRGDLVKNLPLILNNPNSAIFIVKNDTEEIVGLAIVNLYQKAYYLEGRLDDVVIDKDSRGQGLSKSLVQATIEWAKSKGAESIELASRPARVEANNLYKSLGFQHRETNVFKLNL
ncbi:MAG: hypothetical protein QG623_368 [Patescibacteria group bacterium]|nr:hypothetical protein [Patescibacteria group bacterium]